MTIRVLSESEITPEGHRLRAEMAAECDALLAARREARERGVGRKNPLNNP